MQEHNTIIGRLLSGVNRRKFKRIVDKRNGDFAIKKLSCREQFVAIFLGQISHCDSLREIVDLIKLHSNQHYHLGIKKDIARSTLAKANETRDWRIYRDVFLDLIKNLQKNEQFQASEVIQIIDSTPINLNLTQHPWIETTMKIKGLKTHVVYDLTNNMPIYFDITGARCNDINFAREEIEIKKGAAYICDKGYTDYNWWNEINEKGAFFVTRLKKNARIEPISTLQVTNELISSQIVQLTNKHPRAHATNNYAFKPLKLVYVKREGKEPLTLVTNDFKRSDEEISELYKQRWQIELFFKWIKQNLKIKKFLGRSQNAIKTQICIAMIVFVLLRAAEELKEICMNISYKNLLKIVGNSLFNCLKLRDYGKKRYKNPNQLQFEWTLAT